MEDEKSENISEDDNASEDCDSENISEHPQTSSSQEDSDDNFSIDIQSNKFMLLNTE